MTLKNLTPAHLRCGLGQCPGVYKEHNSSRLFIIGKAVRKSDIMEQVGPDEALVQVEKALLANIGGPVSRFFMRLGL